MKKKFLLFVVAIAIFAFVSMNVKVAFNTDVFSTFSLAKSQTALAAPNLAYAFPVDYFVVTHDGYEECCSNNWPSCTTPTYGHYINERWFVDCSIPGDIECEQDQYTHSQHLFDDGCYCLISEDL